MAQYQMPISRIMKNNIDAILNEDYKIGWGETRNQSDIHITKRPKSSIMLIEVKFFGQDPKRLTPFELTPTEVTRISISQNFEESYCDDITVVCTLTPTELLSILDNYRNLKCKITMYEKNPFYNYVNYREPIYDREFRVIMKDKELRKRVSKQALIPDNKLDENGEHHDQSFSNIEFQLIEEEAYLVRKKKFNFQARDVTVRDIIMYMAQCCGVSNICIVDPDNKSKMTNVIIPPQQTFSSCMEYIQDRYGVYEKGLGYYIMDDTFYVYPIYETQPTTPESAHLYYAGPDNSSGSKIFHAFSDKVCHVVVNSTPVIKDLVDGGIENFGNAILFQNADRIIDLQSTIGEGEGDEASRLGMGKIDLKEPNTLMYGFKEDDTGIMDNVYTVTYVFDNNNKYKLKSALHGYRRSIIGIKWNVAVPCIFKPGYLIYYHYDSEDTSRREQGEDFGNSSMYTTRKGVCQRVVYDIRPIGAKPAGKDTYEYSCTASIVLSTEYEPGTPSKPAEFNTSSVASSAYAAGSTPTTSTGIDALKNQAASTIKKDSVNSTGDNLAAMTEASGSVTSTSVSSVFSKTVSNAASKVASGVSALGSAVKGLFGF